MPGICLRVLYSFTISDHQIMVVGGCPSGEDFSEGMVPKTIALDGGNSSTFARV